MSWPIDNITTAHLDATTDDPSLARAELKNALDALKLILAEVTVGKSIWHTGNLIKASDGGKIDNFIAGTIMTFQQTAAPVGWTKITSHDNKAFRVVSGAAGSGGSVAFTTALANRDVSSVNLVASQCGMVSHTHKMFDSTVASGSNVIRNKPDDQAASDYNAGDFNNTVMGASIGAATHGDTGAANQSVSTATHKHTLDMTVMYLDLIIASKAV